MGVRTNIKMNQFDYNLVYETARIFAKNKNYDTEHSNIGFHPQQVV